MTATRGILLIILMAVMIPLLVRCRFRIQASVGEASRSVYNSSTVACTTKKLADLSFFSPETLNKLSTCSFSGPFLDVPSTESAEAPSAEYRNPLPNAGRPLTNPKTPNPRPETWNEEALTSRGPSKLTYSLQEALHSQFKRAKV